MRAICKRSAATRTGGSSFSQLLFSLLIGPPPAASATAVGSVGDGSARQLRLLKDDLASRVAAFARPEQQATLHSLCLHNYNVSHAPLVPRGCSSPQHTRSLPVVSVSHVTVVVCTAVAGPCSCSVQLCPLPYLHPPRLLFLFLTASTLNSHGHSRGLLAQDAHEFLCAAFDRLESDASAAESQLRQQPGRPISQPASSQMP